MDANRWNDFIYAVNNGWSKEELVPPIQNKDEDETFDWMVAELAEMRKDNPKAAFWPVEKDW